MRPTLIAGLLSLAMLAAGSACSEKSSPSAPNTPGPLDLTGRWNSALTFQGINSTMTWTLTQNNSAVSGPVLLSLPSGTVLLNGFLQGTLTGTSMPYTITVAPGAVPSQPSCAGQLAGNMTVSNGAPATMTGTLGVGSSSCTIQFPASNITLTKQ
jgi:hypothetical protein